MQHKCTVCGSVYEAGADEILNGCLCGNKLFYFLKGKKDQDTNITYNCKENECFYEFEDDENDELIVFDLEAVNVICNGKYELDIESILSNKGLVYKYGEGKYSIDIDNNLKKGR